MNDKIEAMASMSAKDGFKFFSSGLSVGLTNLASGYAIGVIGKESARDHAGRIVELIFAQALGLYGFILAIIMSN